MTGSMGRRLWDFAPSQVVNYRPPTRAVFLIRAIVHFAAYQLVMSWMDGIDIYIKQVPFKTTLNQPGSHALPLADQILCGLAIGTFLSCGMAMIYDLLSICFVASDLPSSSSWPHLSRISGVIFGITCFVEASHTLVTAYSPSSFQPIIKRSEGIIRLLRVTLTFAMSTLCTLSLYIGSQRTRLILIVISGTGRS